MTNRQISYEFMYYVVIGNKGARALFDTYEPQGAWASEDFDTWKPAVNELLGPKGKPVKDNN